MKIDTFIVDKSGIRLDKFLADKFNDYSRSQIQKYISNGDITVNSKIQPAKYIVARNDEIQFNFSDNLNNTDFVTPQEIPLDIIYEDDDIIVINKLAGMTVHPGVGNKNGTMANALAFHCSQLSNVNGAIRPGIVHRLDKDTSGVIIAAKSNFAHMKLAEQFAKRSVEKEYFGITWGLWKRKQGLIDQPIRRKRNDPTSFFVNAAGKESQTEFIIIKETQYFSYITYFPKTGRTHQIRVHSAFIGNPIIGDEKYGGGRSRISGYLPEITKKLEQVLNLVQHHILHAQKITFVHPSTQKEMSFKAELPNNTNNIISKIAILDV